MTAAELYIAVSARLLRLRVEREVPDAEESVWADVLDTLWDDLDAGEVAAVKTAIAARWELVEEGCDFQRKFR